MRKKPWFFFYKKIFFPMIMRRCPYVQLSGTLSCETSNLGNETKETVNNECTATHEIPMIGEAMTEKRKPAKAKQPKDLYLIVEKLQAQPREEKKKRFYNFKDATSLRALRIHRHLRALESEILKSDNRAISVHADEKSKRIVISIQNDQVHCRRYAYLSPKEYRMLRRNRRVAYALRKSQEDVA
jgi:hypothetical protein